MAKSATLQTIADKLNVSRSTVSRVLNGTYHENGISEATAKIVIAKANDLKYIKNESARLLRTQKTNTIGVIVRDITNPFYSEFVKIIENLLYTRGYTVIICNTNYDFISEQGHINSLLSRKVDGIVWSPVGNSYKNILFVRERNVPIILFDSIVDSIDTDCIVVNNELGVNKAVDYLITVRGHRNNEDVSKSSNPITDI